MSNLKKYLEMLERKDRQQLLSDFLTNFDPSIRIARKPRDINDLANSKLDLDDVDMDAREQLSNALHGLEVIDFSDIYSKGSELTFSSFFEGRTPNTFILKYNDLYFFVDTGGYNYCRYVLQLINYDSYF